MKFAGINLANFMDAEGFNEGLITRNAIDANSKLRRAGMIAKGSLLGSGLKAMADIEMGKLGASATEYAGEQAGNSALFSGIMGGLSGLGSGIIGRKPPGIGTGAGFGQVGTIGSDMADYGYSSAQDIAFNNGIPGFVGNSDGLVMLDTDPWFFRCPAPL